MLDGLDGCARSGQRDRSIGEDKPDIHADERSASPKHETHEASDAFVALHAGAVINPDDGQVLDVVKHLEKCDAHKNVLDAVVAVPPKNNAAEKQGELHWTNHSGLRPVPPLAPCK